MKIIFILALSFKIENCHDQSSKIKSPFNFNLSSSCYSLELTWSELLFEYHIRLLDVHQRMELALTSASETSEIGKKWWTKNSFII